MTRYLEAPDTQTVHIKDNFGAIGDGQFSDKAAFNAFNVWARAQTTAVRLIIPPGTYVGFTPGTATPAAFGDDFFVGIKDLTIEAYGVTLSFLRGGFGFDVNPSSPITTWANVNQVNSGATSATCITASQAGQFSVGSWVGVTSLEMQPVGFPPNWYYVDYVKVLTVNTNTGVVTFTQPVFSTHKTTYPVTSVPTWTQDPLGSTGGPASIFALAPDWDQSLRIYGLTIPAGPTETIFTMRRLYCADCSFNCNIAPSCNQHATFERCSFTTEGGSYLVEVDKNIQNLRFIDCNISTLLFQSASDSCVIDSCNIGTFSGTVKNMVIRNSYIASLAMLPPAVGANRQMEIHNTTIAAITTGTSVNQLLVANLTFSNGTFRIALSNTYTQFVYRFAIPGSKCYFGSTGSNNTWNFGSPFIITSVYQDATNVYFDTTLSSVPTFTGSFTTGPLLAQHPCPRLVASNNFGSDTAIMTGKQTNATGKQTTERPAFEYAHKVYCEDLIQPGSSAVTQQIQQWGTLVLLTVNVIRAYTGAQSTLTMHPIGKFGANVVNASNAVVAFDLTINLKTAGIRTVSPTTVTGNVSGDVITAPGAVWFVQYGLQPWMSASIAADTPNQYPIVEIELITDQGITSLEYTVQ